MRKHLKDYFIPHEGNDYKPHSLQKAAMTGMVLMVLLSFTLANVQSFLWVASDWMVSTVLPAVIIDLTNEARADDLLGQLRHSSTLDAAAKLKAEHMAERGYFAHFSPEGVSPWFWFAEAHYNFVHAGENLAIHFVDSDDVVQAWMDSPTHRANIMNGNYTEIGVGTAEGEFEGFKTVYVVQLFGTPAATPAVAGTQVVQVAEVPVIALEPIVVEEVPDETAVLAEAVEIIETVSIIAPEPEVMEVAELTPVTVREVTTAPETKETLFSDFIATSTGGIPASIDPIDTQTLHNTPYFLKLLTQPHVVLQILYVTIGLLVLVSLVLSIVIEIRKQHPLQIAYGLAMVLLMFGLFQLHGILSAGVIIV